MSLAINLETDDVKDHVRVLVEAHEVEYAQTSLDTLAEHFTRLSDDLVPELDETQLLIIALRRAGVLGKTEAMKLQARYLAERQLAI